MRGINFKGLAPLRLSLCACVHRGCVLRVFFLQTCVVFGCFAGPILRQFWYYASSKMSLKKSEQKGCENGGAVDERKMSSGAVGPFKEKKTGEAE